MKYFAYGSNLDWCQMRYRCPSTKFICRAVYKDHVLDFPRTSKKRHGGVADVKRLDGHELWGVVYDIPPEEIDNLNDCEGYKPHRAEQENCYNPGNITVLAEGDVDKPVQVTMYRAVPEIAASPSKAYVELIVAGAKFWDLPEPYVRELEDIEDVL